MCIWFLLLFRLEHSSKRNRYVKVPCIQERAFSEELYKIGEKMGVTEKAMQNLRAELPENSGHNHRMQAVRVMRAKGQ